MAETAFLLGAGINRCIRGPDGLVPPLALDFFRQALRHPRFAAVSMTPLLEPLFAFIERYWHRGRQDLVASDFDLEECFTFIELQRREAIASGDQEEIGSALRLEQVLTRLLLDFMSECEHWFFTCEEFCGLAARIWDQRATVLTFNYDTMLESAIESASPTTAWEMAALFSRNPNQDAITDDEVGYSPSEWNSYVGYGVAFDEVALRLPGLTRMVKGARYFGHDRNKFSPPGFLKLHGSLGWFFRSGYQIDGVKLEGGGGAQAGQSVLRRSSPSVGWPEIDGPDLEVLLPLIITPVLNKPYEQHPVFRSVWTQARNELRECHKLVIGGYSFPATDFHVRRLLREAFCDHGPKELHVINPDKEVVSVAKELCNYRQAVTICTSVAEFLAGSV